MHKYHPAVYTRAAFLSATLLAAFPAMGAIVQPGGDIFLDGSFQGMTYGASGSANLAPRLFIGDFASTLPPYDQIIGTGLEFSYAPPTFGSSVVNFTYRLTNNDFSSFSNLRFFLDLKAQGQTSFLDTATAVGFGAPAAPGAADQFQIFDFNAAGDKPLQRIEASNTLNGSAAATCSTGCFSDLALQWDLSELLVGQTWEINATLTDNPSLVTGGRYLMASSLGPDGTQIIFGNPVITAVPLPSALLLFGSGLLGLATLRRRKTR